MIIVSGSEPFKEISRVPYLPDDMTVGFVIGDFIMTQCTEVATVFTTVGILLGHNLTDATNMKNQYDFHVIKSNLKQLTKYVSFYIFCIR